VRTRLGLSVGVVALAAVTATGAFGDSGGSRTSAAVAQPTLAVAIVGSGRVTSAPVGISCPGKCAAAFAAGSRVLLTPTPRGGSRFLRWGGDCTGARACRVRVSGLAAVAAQFVGLAAAPTPAPTSAVVPGGYSGQNSQNGNGVAFSVPAGGRSVLNFSLPRVNLVCVGGGGISDHIWFSKIAIKADRSFTATGSQDGVVNGVRAKSTYTARGRFEGKSANGAAAATGVFRADTAYADRTRTCTTNDQTWTATRSSAPSTGPIVPGTYSGQNSQNGNGVTLSVPAGGGGVLNFSIPRVNLVCVGGGGVSDQIRIEQVTIKPDRSFTATASQDGVSSGVRAKFTYVVSGSFEGFDRAGAPIAAGVYREDMAYADGTRTCTSNDQTWTTARSG
jgi:hypothetical protein